MTLPYKRSVTLVELLVAIVILGFLVVGIANIDRFSRSQLQYDDQRVSLQNEASSVLEHMQKALAQAIGDFNQAAVNINITGDPTLTAWVDDNKNGMRDSPDIQIAYIYKGSPTYQLWYYPNYANATYQVIGNKIYNFTRTLSLNYLDVGITVCWDCSEANSACGTAPNPKMTIINRIALPYVSTN